MTDAPVKSVVRLILIIVGVVATLYILYMLRKPLSWLFIATFLAVALSAPVNVLARHMRRGFAIALVYVGVLMLPLLLLALIVPPLVTQADKFTKNVPDYARDVTRFVERNDRLQRLNRDYNITDRLEEEAGKLPGKLGGAAGTLQDVGLGIVNSVFAGITILVLTAFMLGSGRRWVDAALSLRPPATAERMRRTLDRMASAVGGYVAGALTISVISGTLTFIFLTILGVPFAAPLAVVMGSFSLIPLVGATIAAVLIAVVTLFEDFPTATIAWIIWAIVYQQFENHVIQPQIQKRTVDVQPFIVIVSVLFGATLLGVVGAIVAIPAAASIQIVIREYWDWRRLSLKPVEDARPVAGPTEEPPSVPPRADEPSPA
ncbi:MAG: AI-2E family transporter [Nocardioidaceae bacterium]